MTVGLRWARGGWLAPVALAGAALLGGCGGGDDAKPGEAAQAAGERRQALADHAEGRRDGAVPVRKVRAYLRKGITGLVVSPDGRTVAVSGGDGKVRLFDTERGEL
ncbi:MAG TPA: hypothetical protein VLA16_00360, partial [Ideonella sp.]|nr:hypothetical protein [Ideonella sp.]